MIVFFVINFYNILMKKSAKAKLIFIFSILFFLILWEVLALIIDSSFVLPKLDDVFKSLFNYCSSQKFWTSAFTSFLRVLVSFFLTVVLGIVIGFASGLCSDFETFLKFPLTAIRSTPVVALVMIVLFWFPSQTLPSICAVLMCLPVMIDASSGAIKNVEKNLLEMAKVFDFRFSTKIFGLYFPVIRPYILNASKTVFSQGWKIVAAGEILSMPRFALGTMLQDNRIILESSNVFALVLALIIFCIATEKLVFIFVNLFFKMINRIKKNKIKSFLNLENTIGCPKSSGDGIVSIKNLCFGFQIENSSEKILFQNFSFDFDPLQITAIIAPSGTGKTSLLKILAGLVPDTKWTGLVKCPKVSFIFQEPRLILQETVLQNVALPILSQMPSRNMKKLAYKKSFEYLKKVGLENRCFDLVENLSGGEKQKVQVARAFAFDASVVLMDEGTSSLDEKSRSELWQTINSLLKENPRTLIFVTHNQVEAKNYSHKILNLVSEKKSSC